MAILDQDDRCGQPRDFRQRVRDVNDRDLCLIAQSLDEGKNLFLQRLVQGGQRFVHEQKMRRREQCPADCYPLFFSARKRAGTSLQKVPDIEEIEHLFDADGPLFARREPLPVQEILSDCEMREKPRLLKNVAKAPSMFGHKNALAGVDQSPAIQDDRALIGAHNSGNDVQK